MIRDRTTRITAEALSHDQQPNPDGLVTRDSTTGRYQYVDGARRWVRAEPELVPDRIDEMGEVAPSGGQGIDEFAIAAATTPRIAARQEKLRSHLTYFEQAAERIDQAIEIDRSTLQTTREFEQVLERRMRFTELTLAQRGDLGILVFWFVMFVAAIVAEITTTFYNIQRAELEHASLVFTVCLAYLSFISTFALLKWLDPAAAGSSHRKLFATIAVTCVPLAMFLFAWKLDALLEFDLMDASATSGPAFMWIVFLVQSSFAIAVYLISQKIGEVWYRFLGYRLQRTSEFQSISLRIEQQIDVRESILPIIADFRAALASIEAHKRSAINSFRTAQHQSAERAKRKQELAEAEANAARLRALNGRVVERQSKTNGKA